MSAQARYWLLTIPELKWKKPDVLPDHIAYLRGQTEIGESGYRHWQLLVAYTSKQRRRRVTLFLMLFEYVRLYVTSPNATPRRLDPRQLWPTFGRTRRQLFPPVSNWENWPLTGTTQQIGTGSLPPPSPDSLMRSQPISSSGATTRSNRSRRCSFSACIITTRIILNPLPWNERYEYSGVQQEPENRTARGLRQGWTPIQRTPVQSSGTDTVDISMSSLTNSEARSAFLMSSDGSINTPSTWRPNTGQMYSAHQQFGLHQTLTPEIGIQTSTKEQPGR